MKTSDELFQENQGLVYKVFNDWFQDYRWLEDDLLQEGMLALCNAVNSGFTEEGEAEFSTFAYKCIKNAMLQFVTREHRQQLGAVSMQSKKDEDSCTYEDTVGVTDDYSSNNLWCIIYSCCSTERDVFIVRKRAAGYSLKEIAEELNVTPVRVSEILSSIRRAVKERYKEF